MINLINEDCITAMKSIEDKSIDMILVDPPYGTTGLKWDSVIPFDKLWEQYKRIIKDNGAIVLFGTEPFSSYLRMSNMNMWKYDWIWEKSKVGNIFNCKNSPLKIYETISVFSKASIANGSKIMMKYYPQGLSECCIEKQNVERETEIIGNRKSRKGSYKQQTTGYPKNILRFHSEGKTVFPTQKPVALLEYLIKTYTKEDEIVLDSCMGSGSTGVACVHTKRGFIGIEKEQRHYNLAAQRILESQDLIIKEFQSI